MKIFEVKYNVCYGLDVKEEVVELREDRLNQIKKSEAEGKYYSNVIILRDLGEENRELVETWFNIAKKNPWISEAYDPEFTKEIFTECKELSYLISELKSGNWCLGQAFYYKNLCFINQVNAGDEWLVIRDDIDFESASCGLMIKRHGEEYFELWIEDCLEATPDELKTLEYVKKKKGAYKMIYERFIRQISANKN